MSAYVRYLYTKHASKRNMTTRNKLNHPVFLWKRVCTLLTEYTEINWIEARLQWSLLGDFFETAPCFCVGKDVPLLQVVNRMHNILLIRYRKTTMAENQLLFGLALSSTSEVTTFSLFKAKIYKVTIKYVEDITRWREDMNFMFE